MKEFKRKQYAKAVLTNLHGLRQRRFVGDYSASDTLIDFEKAVELAQLTKRQSEAIRLIYDVGLTQKNAATIMDIEPNTLNELLKRATEELDEVYEMWAWMDKEITSDEFKNEMEAQ